MGTSITQMGNRRRVTRDALILNMPEGDQDRGAGATATQNAAIDTVLFREAMSRFGAAVHIVTTDGPGGKAGFTATAVCSVSDDPPTLLVCLNRSSQITSVLSRNRVLCVNTLAADGSSIAEVFAGRTGLFMERRFEAGSWSVLKTGSPVLEVAIVAMDCSVVEVKSVATHNVFFATVEAIRRGQHVPALIYQDRTYKHV